MDVFLNQHLLISGDKLCVIGCNVLETNKRCARIYKHPFLQFSKMVYALRLSRTGKAIKNLIMATLQSDFNIK